MSTRVPSLRALAERLRDPLWLPLLSALFAFGAFEAASLGSGQTVLVAARNLPAGTPLTQADVRRVRWSGSLPGPVLAIPQGHLLVPVAQGLPLLRSTVVLKNRHPSAALEVVGIPAEALLSSPPLTSGERVAVYIAAAGLPLQRLVPSATVAAGSAAGAIALIVSPASLPALLAGLAAGHLIVVATPQD